MEKQLAGTRTWHMTKNRHRHRLAKRHVAHGPVAELYGQHQRRQRYTVFGIVQPPRRDDKESSCNDYRQDNARLKLHTSKYIFDIDANMAFATDSKQPEYQLKEMLRFLR